MIRMTLLLSALPLTALPAYAQQRDPNEVMTRRVSTVEGKSVLVRNYASWKSDCTSRGEPVVTVDTQPQHGSVSVRSGMSTIREYTGDGAHCVGQQVAGTSVWYQPAPGFHGIDQFAITINAMHMFHDRAVIEVR